MKLIKACIAMAAFAAIFVVPSLASAVQLTVPTGTTATAGTALVGTNVAHAETPTTTRLTTAAGTVECTTATLNGVVTKDEGGVVEGEVTTAEFSGTGGKTPHTTHCTGTGALGSSVTVTPSHTSNPVIHNGLTSLPWCVKPLAEDKLQVRGGKCSEASRPLTFTLHGLLSCSYEAAEVKAEYTTHPAQAVATVKDAKFTRMTNSSAFCPAEGKLDLAFTLENGAGQAAYLDK